MPRYPRYSDDALMKALSRLTAELGEFPTETAYTLHARPGEADASLYRKRYGSWGQAQARWVQWEVEQAKVD